MQNGVIPFLTTCEQRKSSSSSSSAVQKKLAELAVTLSQAGQNFEVPEVLLAVDVFVVQVFDEARKKSAPLPTAEQHATVLGDSALVNQLHSGVNKWIKQIQGVTKYFSGGGTSITGPAIAEVNFWLSVEKALFGVRSQLQTPEVEFTLNLLRMGKRFLTSVSFEADTGLKAAIEQVANYLLLLRDFPIQDLLAATSLEGVQGAIRTIFGHLKKVKSATQYPLGRRAANFWDPRDNRLEPETPEKSLSRPDSSKNSLERRHRSSDASS